MASTDFSGIEGTELDIFKSAWDEGGVGGASSLMVPGLQTGQSRYHQQIRQAAQQAGPWGGMFQAVKGLPQAGKELVDTLLMRSPIEDLRDISELTFGVDFSTGEDLTDVGRALRWMGMIAPGVYGAKTIAGRALRGGLDPEMRRFLGYEGDVAMFDRAKVAEIEGMRRTDVTLPAETTSPAFRMGRYNQIAFLRREGAPRFF